MFSRLFYFSFFISTFRCLAAACPKFVLLRLSSTTPCRITTAGGTSSSSSSPVMMSAAFRESCASRRLRSFGTMSSYQRSKRLHENANIIIEVKASVRIPARSLPSQKPSQRISVAAASPSSKKFAAPWIAKRKTPAAVGSALLDINSNRCGVGVLLDNLPNLICHIFAGAVQIR